ncbi:hypothetical protein [Dysgonomonas sp. 520]|uniref:hypothetical protein n=1 Tax=Dysgonomonas sp. 520 TaxID=2302931 RepID=UPI0013D628F6|nr:hypothetical protein [Dysgonomonas sp. 520]
MEKEKHKQNGYTKLLIELLEGMFMELYPEDNNNKAITYYGWDGIKKEETHHKPNKK